MDEEKLSNELKKWFESNDIGNKQFLKNNEVAKTLVKYLKKEDRWKINPKKIQGMGSEEFFEDAWRGMPEFEQEDLMPIKQVVVSFQKLEDINDFSKIVNQKITKKTKSIWFPKQELIKPSDYRYIDES
jgi:hypothetical protein